ncbi:YciI family protein [Rhizobium mayense]|uniref:YciI family protein n=1 Tax=Rhizobium mayense TaxID=1312184 RepID=A0ABT7JSI3_9HYPH|nr:YciI family protein [Rhizobium mayense]MDL2398867.1 YciI family protein [Rhizobium mayense]
MLAIRVALSDPGKASARARYLEDHRNYLRSGLLRIRQSGPILDEVGDASGGIVVAEVGSLDEMRQFSAQDPFVIHGVYADVSIYQWTPTIKDAGSVDAATA